MIITDPIELTVGQLAQLVPPTGGQQFSQLKLSNLSPFVLLINNGGGSDYVAPWTEVLLNLTGQNAPVGISPMQAIGGTTPSGASNQVNATWFLPTEKPDGTWPISLTANALAASISGGTITLSGQVPVINGTPTPLQIGGTVTADPPLATSAPGAGQRTINITGTAVQLPNSGTLKAGVLMRALAANTDPVYLGPSSVTTGNGLEIDKNDPAFMVPVNNTNLLYINGTAGDGVSFLVV